MSAERPKPGGPGHEHDWVESTTVEIWELACGRVPRPAPGWVTRERMRVCVTCGRLERNDEWGEWVRVPAP